MDHRLQPVPGSAVGEWKKRTIAATVHLPRLGGQGVLVPGGLVLTAAHCIGWSATGGMALGDHCLEKVKPKIGRSFRLSVWAVEPVADIAVLGEPDTQQFSADAAAFEAFREATTAVPVHAEDFKEETAVRVHVLTHKGTWIDASSILYGRHAAPSTSPITPKSEIQGGTSGGPILDDAGRLVGVVSFSGAASNGGEHGLAGAFPRPHRALPGWIWHRIEASSRKGAR